MRRDSFVDDQSLPHRFTHADNPVAPGQEQAIGNDPFAAALIGKVPAMLGEKNRRPTGEIAPEQRIKKRSVLMGMDQVHVFLPQHLGQAHHAAPIQTRLASNYMDREPLAPQLLAQTAELV